ncbi:MAG: oxidoreductase [Vulcanimicrobiota bacterium]
MKYKEMFICTGKVALITGGCGLIGRELVSALREFGALVYVADVVEYKSGTMANDEDIHYLYLDITSEASIREAFGILIERTKKIDILINSAYPRTKDWGAKFENVAFESWKKNIDWHLGGYFLCCQLAAKQMRKQKNGVIINIASIYGVTAPDFTIYEGTQMTMPVAYSAIKSALIGMTKYISTYYAKDGIRANVISPGGVFDSQPNSFVERYSSKTPLGRMGKQEDIAGAVIYLASDASSYVTGQNLIVDGGWTTW